MAGRPTIDYEDTYDNGLGIPLYDSNTMNHALMNKFFRYRYYNVQNSVGKTREVVFFTKPDLHLLNGDTINPELQNPFFTELCNTRPDIVHELQSSSGSQSSPFITLFTNTIRTNLDLPSIDSTDTENSTTSYGESVTYRSTSITSDSNHEFSLEFEDTKLLSVYKLLKAWDEYVREKDKGLITPPSRNYTTNRELHDQVCAFKFILDEDGETILYYAKLWGVYPKRVPRDVFAGIPESGLNIPTSFHAQWVEDLDPTIIKDFQHLVSDYVGTEMEVWDSDKWQMNMDLAVCPNIVHSDNTSIPGGKYRLIWTK